MTTPGGSKTDFDSLTKSEEPKTTEHRNRDAKRGPDTDFESLMKSMPQGVRPYQHRSPTDYIIDALTPLMIFLMVFSVVFFLLDVRFIYTEDHDFNLRIFAFCMLVGVVALNRLIAKQGSEESVLYIVLFGGVTFIYTLTTTSAYGVGSVARGFLDQPLAAAIFNTAVVGFLWWVTNRLVHECAIDENKTAGDVGILTGTIRNFRRAVQPREPKKPARKTKRQKDHIIEAMELEEVDPLEWKPEEKKKESTYVPPTERLSKRHPGISIFYFSVPVMGIFALGLPVLMQGGRLWILTGYAYVVLYTATALTLLLLTSLGGLREYFRARRVYFPTTIGFFWFGLGAVMVAMVCFGAATLPDPPLPPAASIESHETTYWSRDSNFELQFPVAAAAQRVNQSPITDTIGYVVLAVFALFALYSALRGLGALAAAVGRRRHRLPAFVTRLFDWVDRLLLGLLSAPRLPIPEARRRVSREIATSVKYRNPMAGQGIGSGADVAGYVAHAYDALCALAYDLGVPRQKGQTPFEFIRSFPKELWPLRDEALELTHLYVKSAYSPELPDERVLDRLRKFWMTYEKVREKIVK